jgi:hypothetical protein
MTVKAAVRQRRIDLWPRTVHQYQPHAEDVQQRKVMNDVRPIGVRNGVATEQDHEGPVAVGADVGR